MSKTLLQQSGKSATASKGGSGSSSGLINNRHQLNMVWKSTRRHEALPPAMGHRGSPPLKSCLKKSPITAFNGYEELSMHRSSKSLSSKSLSSKSLGSKKGVLRKRRNSSRKVDHERSYQTPPPPSASPSIIPIRNWVRTSSASSASDASSDMWGRPTDGSDSSSSERGAEAETETGLDSSRHRAQQSQQGSGDSEGSITKQGQDSSQQLLTSEHSTGSASSASESPPKSVRFSDVQVRDYERVIGDNPSCSSGVPISIGWKYGKTRSIALDNFESARQRRRTQMQMIMPRNVREKLLMSWGASCSDIIEAIRVNVRVKNKRRQTVTNLGKVERLEEAFESATRKLKRTLLLRRRTGDKVREMRERADVAARTLATLQIAEDRALTEIAADRRIRVEREPEDDDQLDQLDVKVAGSSSAEPNDGAGSVSSHGQSDALSSIDGLTIGNSTTASVLEMERFYRELEQEMFGDLEIPPSMVGQTLEVPVTLDIDVVTENSPCEFVPDEPSDDTNPADDADLSEQKTDSPTKPEKPRPVIYCEPRLPYRKNSGDISLLSQSLETRHYHPHHLQEKVRSLELDDPELMGPLKDHFSRISFSTLSGIHKIETLEVDDPELMGPLKDHFSRISSSSLAHTHDRLHYPAPRYAHDRRTEDPELPEPETAQLSGSLESVNSQRQGQKKQNIYARSRLPPASLHTDPLEEFWIGGSDHGVFQRPRSGHLHHAPRYAMDDRRIDFNSAQIIYSDGGHHDRSYLGQSHNASPPIYYSPTHWMENRDAPAVPEHTHDSVIISEGSYSGYPPGGVSVNHYRNDAAPYAPAHSRALPSSYY